jgi:hypothetical protein
MPGKAIKGTDGRLKKNRLKKAAKSKAAASRSQRKTGKTGAEKKKRKRATK